VRQQIEHGYHWPTVVAHLALLHNMKYDWQRGMDEILWSIACEWQIYLIFALLLVPLWRRAGLWAMLAACAAIAAAITDAWARGWCFYLIPWMIPIFGIGAAAANIGFGTGPRVVAMRRWPWGAITLASLAAMIAGIWLLDVSVVPEAMRMPAQYYHVSVRVRWIYDVLAALTTASLIVWLTLGWRQGGAPSGMAARVRRLLESRGLQSLGLVSYSLYLTHGIVIVSIARLTAPLWEYRLLHWTVVMVGGPLVSLAVAAVFHRCFERRFMSVETRAMMPRRGLPPPAS
jgi:peptidoglycan/LPS O-acetylase OafA/YrhL